MLNVKSANSHDNGRTRLEISQMPRISSQATTANCTTGKDIQPTLGSGDTLMPYRFNDAATSNNNPIKTATLRAKRLLTADC